MLQVYKYTHINYQHTLYRMSGEHEMQSMSVWRSSVILLYVGLNGKVRERR